MSEKEAHPGDPGVEVIGTTKRVLSCPQGAAARLELDSLIHRMLERRAAVKSQLNKLKNAAKSVKERFTAIESEIEELHREWEAPEVDRLVECRVERTTTSVRVVR